MRFKQWIEEQEQAESVWGSYVVPMAKAAGQAAVNMALGPDAGIDVSPQQLSNLGTTAQYAAGAAANAAKQAKYIAQNRGWVKMSPQEIQLLQQQCNVMGDQQACAKLCAQGHTDACRR